MQESFTLELPYVAPIARGHEIEWRTFWGTKGFLSKEDVPLAPPMVTDLETGVVYAEAWMFEEFTMYVSGQMRDMPMDVRPDLREHSRGQGKVVACRVAFIGSGDSRYGQTTLIVEPKAAASGYR